MGGGVKGVRVGGGVKGEGWEEELKGEGWVEIKERGMGGGDKGERDGRRS